MPNISMMGSQNIRSGRSMLSLAGLQEADQIIGDHQAQKFFNIGSGCCSHCGEYKEPWDECENLLCASNSDIRRMHRDMEESQIVDSLSGTLGTIGINNRTMTVRDRAGITRLAFGDTTAIRGASAEIIGAEELLAYYETPVTDFDDEVEEDSDEELSSEDFRMESDSGHTTGVTSRLDSMEAVLTSLRNQLAMMSPPPSGWIQADGRGYAWASHTGGSISRANVTGVVNPWSNSIH